MSETNPIVKITTNRGVITLSLDAEKAPASVENFLSYVDQGHYNGTIFHRVIRGFMIQGGGFSPEMVQKDTQAPVKNEAANGLKNVRYSVAMARTQDIDSATSQFFINLADNDFLDHRGPAPSTFGYAVFGQVTEGQDVVDQIANVSTGSYGFHQDVPEDTIEIQSIERL